MIIKKIFLLIIISILCSNMVAQNNPLLAFEKKRLATDKTGMTILASWATANMAVSAFDLNTTNKQVHYYHQMNIIWNGFNTAIAGLGYITAKKTILSSNISAVLKHQNNTEKTFLFNAGLDVAYIASGAYLKERGKSKINPSKLIGYGNAVIVNGGFLFLFDMVMYAIHNKHGKQLNKFIDQLQIKGSGAGIAAIYTF